MKNITKLVSVAAVTALLLSGCAENNGKPFVPLAGDQSPSSETTVTEISEVSFTPAHEGVNAPKVFTYRTDEYMDIYIDGVDKTFLGACEKYMGLSEGELVHYDLTVLFGTPTDRNKLDCNRYMFGISASAEYDEDFWAGLSYEAPEEPDVQNSLYTENDHYEINDGQLTSGFRYTLFDKTEMDEIESYDTCLGISIVRYLGNYKWDYDNFIGWYSPQNADELRVNRLDVSVTEPYAPTEIPNITERVTAKETELVTSETEEYYDEPVNSWEYYEGTVTPPQLLVYESDGFVDLFFDGLTDEFYDAFTDDPSAGFVLQAHIPAADGNMYCVHLTPFVEGRGSMPFVSLSEFDPNQKGENIVHEYSKSTDYGIKYYDMNDGVITSGVLFMIDSKTDIAQALLTAKSCDKMWMSVSGGNYDYCEWTDGAPNLEIKHIPTGEKLRQTLRKSFEDTAVKEVSLTADSADWLFVKTQIENRLDISVIVSDTVGRYGEPFLIHTDAEYDDPFVTFTLDEEKLGDKSIEDLIFLVYDEQQAEWDMPTTSYDSENCSLSTQFIKNGYYLLVDRDVWYEIWGF